MNLIDVLNTHHSSPTADILKTLSLDDITTTNDRTKPSVLCSSHVSVMEYYCTTCKQVLCEMCIKANHKGHVIDKIERKKELVVGQMRQLAAEVEMRVVELNEEASSLIERDSTMVASCEMVVKEYYDKHEKKIEQKIIKLKETLQSIKAHHDQLLQKMDRMTATHTKDRTTYQDMIEQQSANMASLLRSVKALINNNDDVTIVQESDKVIEKLEKVSHYKMESISPAPPKFTFSKMADPLACEIINPRGVTIQGLNKAKSGTNTFTLILTTPLINKPRFRISITLPNGRKADADTIKCTPLGENSWTISFYVPVGSFPLAGLFSKGSKKVIVSVLLCDVEIDGSPFEVPCDRLIGTELVKDLSI